ncbi:lysosomal acid lipase/cholesteryl ester hydrolase-like [Athene cunicularia]|uniref:lysosomal acid lipase/cholesteryl ester hydrolase-like n=1 Tax=Athene cunicularia TaxID=194338 RepID=UPI000EF6CF55|nr:lysosomal acid lipase/cholesteryl ester hydrolase-like [Athene cunicularia]
MWCLLVLLCSQGIVFSTGFRTPSALNSDTSQYRKTYNPETFMNVSEIIRYHGYPSEEYQVTTEDGYILGVFRIPAGRNNQNTGKKPAVLLHHGTLGDSIHWISNLPNNSLGFILADAGYDVWLGNSRGDTWSLKHKTLKPCQKEFWQFSFDEIGKYDIPAELYFIMNKTGQKDVYYVGHSEASTAGFIAFSTYPELAQRVKVFFALGPAATITYATSPLVTLTRLPQSLIRLLFGCKGTLQQNELLKGPLTEICRTLQKVCGSIFCYIAGDRIENLNTSRIDTYIGHYPAGTSVQNAIHWHQLTRAGQFQAYDYGSKENMKKYNQSTPPTYTIEKIGTPIAVWSGGQDKFADPKDMANLLSRIPNLIYHEHFPAWGHLDFIWGLDATEKISILHIPPKTEVLSPENPEMGDTISLLKYY